MMENVSPAEIQSLVGEYWELADRDGLWMGLQDLVDATFYSDPGYMEAAMVLDEHARSDFGPD